MEDETRIVKENTGGHRIRDVKTKSNEMKKSGEGGIDNCHV